MALILVVEDDRLVRRLVREVLRAAGHNVRTAVDGRRGLRLLASATFDLLLTDVLMPGCDGLEVIQQAHRLRPGMPIIAMSGGGQWLKPDKCLNLSNRLGADRTLIKPVSPQRLLDEIRDLLGA
jgi:CheY-like chemotaxis protein